jgi:hypothetical protein
VAAIRGLLAASMKTLGKLRHTSWLQPGFAYLVVYLFCQDRLLVSILANAVCRFEGQSPFG